MEYFTNTESLYSWSPFPWAVFFFFCDFFSSMIVIKRTSVSQGIECLITESTIISFLLGVFILLRWSMLIKLIGHIQHLLRLLGICRWMKRSFLKMETQILRYVLYANFIIYFKGEKFFFGFELIKKALKWCLLILHLLLAIPIFLATFNYQLDHHFKGWHCEYTALWKEFSRVWVDSYYFYYLLFIIYLFCWKRLPWRIIDNMKLQIKN